jgi:hypothetical protein
MGPGQSKIASRPASSYSETIRLKVGSCRAAAKRLGRQPINDVVPPKSKAVQSAVGETVGVAVGATMLEVGRNVGGGCGALVGDCVGPVVGNPAGWGAKKGAARE